MRKVDLEVGLTAEDEEEMHKKIVASGMLSHIGPIDMGRRLLKRLRSSPNVQEGRLRIHDYGYDWRLSPHLLSRRLLEFLENLPCNRPGVPKSERGATVIAHSMGGLFTRHVINQRPSLVAGKQTVRDLYPFSEPPSALMHSRSSGEAILTPHSA